MISPPNLTITTASLLLCSLSTQIPFFFNTWLIDFSVLSYNIIKIKLTKFADFCSSLSSLISNRKFFSLSKSFYSFWHWSFSFKNEIKSEILRFVILSRNEYNNNERTNERTNEKYLLTHSFESSYFWFSFSIKLNAINHKYLFSFSTALLLYFKSGKMIGENMPICICSNLFFLSISECRAYFRYSYNNAQTKPINFKKIKKKKKKRRKKRKTKRSSDWHIISYTLELLELRHWISLYNP